MKRFCIIVLGMVAAGVFASSALAVDLPRLGYIQVCKAANADLKGQFTFSITDSTTPGIPNVVLSPGTCTQPIAVRVGSVTVNELGSSLGLTNGGDPLNPTKEFLNDPTTTWVSATNPGPNSATGFSRTVSVPESTNGTSGVVTVTYANTLKTGVVEACKAIETNSGLTGSWQFTITGGNGFSTTTNAAPGNCSPPITVPAGKVIVRETGDASEAVTAITATQGALPGTDAVLGGPNLDTATVVVAVQAGDASVQTIVTFRNNSVRLKLCKYFTGEPVTTGPYRFTFGTVTGNPGPVGPIAPVTLTAGTAANPICTVVGTFRAGTTVPITEDILPGTKVGSITVNPSTDSYDGSSTAVPGSLSLPNRTVTVQLGKGETVVTYQNVPASPGTLKLCKVAGTSSPPVPPGTSFPFTVTPTNPAGSAINLSLTPGACAVVGTFAFNATLSIVEAAVPNMTVQSITAVPSFVIVGGANTNQPVLSNTVLATRSTSVTIGEGNITEVTYTNIDPPNITVDPGNTGGGGTTGGGTTTGGSSSGGSSSGGSSSGGSSSGGSTVSVPAAVAAAVVGNGVSLITTNTASTSASTKAAVLKAAKLLKLNKQLATNKATLKWLVAKHATAKQLVTKHYLAKQIASLKKSNAKLALQIALVKKQ